MTVRGDLQNALDSWTFDGGEAFELVEQMFTDVVAAVRKRFPDVTLAEAELLLAALYGIRNSRLLTPPPGAQPGSIKSTQFQEEK
jgi:hypothetical protein